MNVEWSRDFDRQSDRMKSDESEHLRQVLQLSAFLLGWLRALEESAMLENEDR